MALTPVFIDFESFWSSDYSLTKMTPIEYVMGYQYETQSVAIREGLNAETEIYFGHKDIAKRFAKIDWDHAMAVAHNMSEFDALILAWKFGIKPKLWGCTLAMARPIHALNVGGSLKALAQHYGLQAKGSLEAVNTKGKRLKDFTIAETAAMRLYNGRDTDLCAELFRRLIKQTSAEELRLIDMTIRMIVEPQVVADMDLLEQALDAERARMAWAIQHLSRKLGQEPEDLAMQLRSAPKFKAMLERFGVEVPMKTSPKTGKSIPAISKTDDGMQELLEHENPDVAAAAALRLDIKSTILESRLQRFLDMARLCDGKMPIPLRYYAASTGRWGGTFKANLQNLPRVNPKDPKPSDALRKSMVAPPGYKVVVADLSGIELRVNLTLWKVQYAMDMWKADPEADLYKPLASEVLGVPMEQMTKQVRQAGKAMHLGCGFGLWSAPRYVAAAKALAQIDVTEEEARIHVVGYRNKHPEVVRGWELCEKALAHAYEGEIQPIDPWGLCTTDNNAIYIPKGVIRYPDLRREPTEKGMRWIYGQGRNKAGIYGAKVDENIVQAIARRVLTDALLAFGRTELGRLYPLAHMVHDEGVYVVRDEHAEEALATLLDIMRTPPTWWPELVTWAEGDIAQNYGDAK